MKRSNFQITSNLGHNVIKHAWNASIRETEKLIKEVALQENTVYELSDYASMKDDDKIHHVFGWRMWVGQNGNTVIFKIEKV